MNPYTQYYVNQVGGLTGFAGVRYQRGHGFFGRIFSTIGNFIRDLAPSIGKRALPSAIGLAQDIMSGENVAQSAKNRLIEVGRNAADETLTQLKTRVQGGRGIKRKRVKSSMFIHGYRVNKRRKTIRKKRK